MKLIFFGKTYRWCVWLWRMDSGLEWRRPKRNSMAFWMRSRCSVDHWDQRGLDVTTGNQKGKTIGFCGFQIDKEMHNWLMLKVDMWWSVIIRASWTVQLCTGQVLSWCQLWFWQEAALVQELEKGEVEEEEEDSNLADQPFDLQDWDLSSFCWGTCETPS